jgi:outer membrane protein assembly complex protein YaeT
MSLVRLRHALSTLAVVLLQTASWPPLAGQTATPPEVSTAAALNGHPIASVSFDPAQQPFDSSEMSALLPIHAGEPYEASGIRAAIERLYATGRYQDIQVDASLTDTGVSIRFLTKPNWFIGNVSSDEDFAEPPSRGQVVNASRLSLGDPFDPAQLITATASVRKLFFDNGYFDAEVEPKLSYENVYNQVNIYFAIRPGRRAHYEAPAVSFSSTPAPDTASAPASDASSVLTEEQITKASGWHHWLFLPGFHGITQSRTRSGIDKIRLKYENANRLLATVVLKDIAPRDDGRRGQPELTIAPGAPVDITVEGARISKGKLKENVPIFQEHTVDADLLAEGSSSLRDYFQSQGYFDVDVSFRQRVSTGGATEISYIVETGLRHRFVHVEIAGNRFFDSKTIRERMFLAPASFESRRGRYSEAYRHRDEDSISSLYQMNGFRDVKVTSRIDDNYRGRKGDIAAFFNIVEGPQYLVSSLTVKGAVHLDLSKTIASLSSQTGQIFSDYNVAADRQTIIRQYGDNGYSGATFQWSATPGPRPNTVDLVFEIDEGQQQFVRAVVITGLHITRPSLVNNQLELKAGSPLSPSALADTQRRLYDLGIFAQVNTAIQNPDGVEDRRNVLFDLEEARRYSITTGFGLEFARIGGSNAVADLSDPGGAPGVSPRVSLDITRLNLFGAGQSLTLSGRLSTLQRKAVLTYFVPRIFGRQKLDATYSLLYDDTHDVRTFESKREEASAQLAQHVTKPITLFYRFTYRHVGVSNLKIDPLLLPQLAQSVRVGLSTFSLVQDRRDDPTDSHKGIYNTIDVGLASKLFGSQTSFVRVLARNATYTRLGPKLVFARETQFGLTPAFDIPSTADPTDPIPLAERFFGGGGNTLRGFPENQAGPRDPLTGFPLGGSALFFNNTELRFPLYGTNINGVLFEDAGNVYSSVGNISFRGDQHNPNDFDYMSHAVGFGIRYRTPVGPIRVDFAYSINPPHYNGFPGNYSQLVQCSAANTCQAQQLQISHFQFFFSIGQAF